MESKKKPILYFLREILIVVIGVLIAVSINNYKERVDNKRYIQKTLTAIKNDITLSKAEVDTIMKRHLKVIEYFEENIETDTGSLGSIVGNLGGVQSPMIKDIGLRYFISNKAELVNFQVISQLTEIETHKNSLSEKIKRLIDFTYEHLNATDLDAKIKFVYNLANVVDSEESLLKSYEKFIEDNKAYFE